MLAAASGISTVGQPATARHTRVFVASSAPDGILAYDWDPATGELSAAGVAANSVSKVAWIAFSHGNAFLYSASELDEFEGKPTGAVASFRVHQGNLEPLSERNSAATGTCHVAVDRTGRMLLSADYTGASAASFGISDGRLSEAVWKQHYTEHGPNPERQQTAHAHFASFSPDNRFAYINDLGGDRIHIYRADPATAKMTAAGEYRGAPGSGARTLHFHPNGKTAYCMNELDSTVDVLDWHKADGGLTLVKRIELLPEGYQGPTRGCDTVITRDGSFVYFANRDNDFLYAFKADAGTGALTPMRRSTCGGKTPRNFTLDPTESWMLVANQDSNWISVIKRNPETGELADKSKDYPALAPMKILFT
jgi:6-phosphogluconolactonase